MLFRSRRGSRRWRTPNTLTADLPVRDTQGIARICDVHQYRSTAGQEDSRSIVVLTTRDEAKQGLLIQSRKIVREECKD